MWLKIGEQEWDLDECIIEGKLSAALFDSCCKSAWTVSAGCALAGDCSGKMGLGNE